MSDVKRPPGSCLSLGVLLCILLGGGASAENDGFGLGDGHRGKLLVTTQGLTVNAYTYLVSPAAAGGTTLTVNDATRFTPNDVLMLLQTVGPPGSAASGAPGPFDLTHSPIGLWELARAASVGSGALTLTAPLIHDFPAALTQVILVPEYSSVAIQADAGIQSGAWDGHSGGVLALLVSGAVTNDGVISADGTGYRGGAPVAGADAGACIGLDEPAPFGAPKGEGFVSASFGPGFSGIGNVGNSGGGGVCSVSGGGGGGNGGVGGVGGDTYYADYSRPVGGRGGAAVAYSLLDHLDLGGGGGAGEAWASDFDMPGGNGGGAIWIRAGGLDGGGTISALGALGGDGCGNDGAGGGGAGGTIAIRLVQPAVCGLIQANGGQGGHCGCLPPGGGGGGGAILVQSPDLSACPMSATAGPAGVSNCGGSGGAQPLTATAGGYTGTVAGLASAYLALPQDGGTADGGILACQLGANVGCRCGSGAGPGVAGAILVGLGLLKRFARKVRLRGEAR